MNSNAKWFAIGALTCAGCFVLGGVGKQPDEEPRRLFVDELFVRRAITVGDGANTATWQLFADKDRGTLMGRTPNGDACFKVAVWGMGSELALEMQGDSDNPSMPERAIRLNLLSTAFMRMMAPDKLTESVKIMLGNGGKWIELIHGGTAQPTWSSFDTPKTP